MDLKQIKEKINSLKNKRDEFCKPIVKELNELEKLRIKAEPKIIDFSEHEGKNISYIAAIDSNENDVYLPTDDIVRVENGKPYFSSYNGGIVYFDFERKKYIRSRHRIEKELDIVCFYDVIFEEDE